MINLNATEAGTTADETSVEFLGQWNRLVSTTNWEKGRIIQDWRAALVLAGAPAVEYSDDAWSRRVGNVTGQHVGRLRRVYERFGGVYTDYNGLYWSHFQAAIDWNDAEMWLEGSLQNQWSVADMRRERWTALGGAPDETPQDSDIISAETDEDVDASESTERASGDFEGSGPLHEGPDFGDDASAYGDSSSADGDADFGAEHTDASSLVTPVRPFAELPELPADLFDAVESFKLAILRHKSAEWKEVACEDVLNYLNALRALAMAPA
ncbi:MAG: hypothetical protein SGJ20_18865 [Planctomycetota bacterium]|nr:hypothetical protein [Planctomycetota bacterium]